MKAWKIFLIPTVITLAIGGIYLFSVWKHRQNPGIGANHDENDTLSKDDLAVVRAFFPQHFEDTQRLIGTSVWMKNGNTIPYFPYAGQVEIARRVGVIPPAEQLDIKRIIKAAVSAQVDDGIEHGSRQVFAVFALPGGKDLFAMPIGFQQGEEEAYYPDIFGSMYFTQPDGPRLDLSYI